VWRCGRRKNGEDWMSIEGVRGGCGSGSCGSGWVVAVAVAVASWQWHTNHFYFPPTLPNSDTNKIKISL
jgi:hypothetical protein